MIVGGGGDHRRLTVVGSSGACGSFSVKAYNFKFIRHLHNHDFKNGL